MSDKAILEINLNEEYKIKIEKGNQFEESIFHEVYKEALKNVIEIVRHYYSHKDSKYDDFNNIIAFTGERGKGKSSSMISFRDALVNKECDDNRVFFERQNDPEQYLKDKSFAEIEIIDPSLFRGGESLFEIILAKMFRKFQNRINEMDCKIDQTHKRELIQHFQKTFQNLQIINSDRKDIFKKDSIEALSKLAISSNLKEDFDKLVDYYLEHFDKKNFLIIAIDDFDVNIENAYKMLEDIRQFLIQPKVILLISCKLEQLSEALMIHYKNIKIENQEDKAKRYIDKLVPFSRRIFLPEVKKLEDIEFKILNDKELVFNNITGNFNELMIKLIFEKLNLIQTNNILNSNFIFPNTIRETQNFINTLLNVPNNQKLRKYIISEVYLLDIKFINILDDLENVSDDLFMITVLRKLLRLNREYIVRRRITEAYTKLSNASIKTTISLGDIYFLLEEFEKNINLEDYDSLKFLDLFKLYFSLRLLNFKGELNTLEITKYGFVNKYMNILPKEKGLKSRDFLQFFGTLDWNYDFLREEEVFILGMFVFYLGEGNEDYRHKLDKDIFVERYTRGILSPFAIWHNVNNIKTLSIILNFSTEGKFVKLNEEWFKNSLFIKQLYNPSFTLKIFEYIGEFRLKIVKDSLPDNYFDTVCLLFVYGIIYSLEKLEDLYKLEGLVKDFTNFPIINEMLKYFNQQIYFNKKINELNDKYKLNLEYDENSFITDELKHVMNEIYNSSIEETTDELSINTKRYLSDLYNEINKTKKFTSRFLNYRIERLKDFPGTEKIIDYFEEIKWKFNEEDDNLFNEYKEELKIYLKNLING